jgi:transposase
MILEKWYYYEIFDSAGLSWKKSQKRNPKTAPLLVKKRRIDPMARSSSP